MIALLRSRFVPPISALLLHSFMSFIVCEKTELGNRMKKIEDELSAQKGKAVAGHAGQATEFRQTLDRFEEDITKCMSAVQKMTYDGLKLENFENEMRLEIADTLSGYLKTSDKKDIFERFFF